MRETPPTLRKDQGRFRVGLLSWHQERSMRGLMIEQLGRRSVLWQRLNLLWERTKSQWMWPLRWRMMICMMTRVPWLGIRMERSVEGEGRRERRHRLSRLITRLHLSFLLMSVISKRLMRRTIKLMMDSLSIRLKRSLIGAHTGLRNLIRARKVESHLKSWKTLPWISRIIVWSKINRVQNRLVGWRKWIRWMKMMLWSPLGVNHRRNLILRERRNLGSQPSQPDLLNLPNPESQIRQRKLRNLEKQPNQGRQQNQENLLKHWKHRKQKRQGRLVNQGNLRKRALKRVKQWNHQNLRRA